MAGLSKERDKLSSQDPYRFDTPSHTSPEGRRDGELEPWEEKGMTEIRKKDCRGPSANLFVYWLEKR